MMGGGIPEGDSMIVAGPSGAGRSIFATQFIHGGLRCGEPGIVAIFEERPEGPQGDVQKSVKEIHGLRPYLSEHAPQP